MTNTENEIEKKTKNVLAVIENLNNEKVDIEEIDQYLDSEIFDGGLNFCIREKVR